MANDDMNRRLMNAQEENSILLEMTRHVGIGRIIGMGELYEKIYGKIWSHRINDTRRIRRAITRLRKSGAPIVSVSATSGGGYYLASAGSEIEEYCRSKEIQAKRILKQVSVLLGKPMQEILGQMIADCGGGDA